MSGIWDGDLLDRENFAKQLIETILERLEHRASGDQSSFILNLDADWGEGKTFFVERLNRQLKADGHVVAMVNAWEDDKSSDPLATVIAAIQDALESALPKNSPTLQSFEKAKRVLGPVAMEVGKQLGTHLLKLGLGISVDRIQAAIVDGYEVDTDVTDKIAEGVAEKFADNIVAKNVADHRQAKRAVAEFRKSVQATAKMLQEDNLKLPLFVIIDELDRCRPEYAIQLLEDLKHIFSISGVAFIVATDSVQLANAVNGVYGQAFDSRKYLRKFFDRVVTFPPATKAKFFIHAAKAYGIDFSKFFKTADIPIEKIFSNFALGTNYSSRDLLQIVDIIATLQASWLYPVPLEPVSILTLTSFFHADPRSFGFRLPREPLEGIPIVPQWDYNGLNQRKPLNSHQLVNALTELSDVLFSEQSLDGIAGQFFHADYHAQHKANLLDKFANKSSFNLYVDYIRLSGRHHFFLDVQS